MEINIPEKIQLWLARQTESGNEDIKDPWQRLRKDMAEGYLSEAEAKLIDSLQQQHIELKTEIEKLQERLGEMQRKEKEKEMIQQISHSLNNKHTKKPLVYKGRPLPYENHNSNVPLQIFITPNDPFIRKDLERWGFWNSSEDDETLMPRIYHKIEEEYYKYVSDMRAWGKKEVWELAFELRAKIMQGSGSDCDSWSHFIGSYFRAAGLPAAFLRVTCGECEYGGHSTLNLFSMRDFRYHHLNSTMGSYSEKMKISEFPTKEDAQNGNDPMGIRKVWLSFNDEYTWNDNEIDLPDEIMNMGL